VLGAAARGVVEHHGRRLGATPGATHEISFRSLSEIMG
jgi:hypothetical protein